MSRPAVFFDRDGVVNVSPGAGYVLRWADFRFAPGVIEALRLCKARGFALVLATSQQGVGKGLMSQSALDEIHANMQAELRQHGAAFDAIHACTCLATDPACTCRKPSPEMILRARDQLDLDLSRSWLIGDHDRDIQMALNAGITNTIRIAAADEKQEAAAAFVLADTAELPAALARWLP